MKLFDRVVWSEGMFLAPHHFQQLDRYHEAYVGARLAGLGRADWGILDCELDTAALATGQLLLRSFTGILPDGTPVGFGGDTLGGDAPPAARPVDAHLGATQPSVTAYLALKREREGAPVVDAAESTRAGASRARYTVERRLALDASSAASEEVEVPLARKNLVVLFENEPRDDFDAIPIAQIERDPSGGLRLSPSYVAPCLTIRASTILTARLTALLSLMAAKQRSLSEERRQRESSTVEFQTRDITRFLQLHTLNSFLPLIQHVTRIETWPTESVFSVLLQLAGQLGTFAGALDPTSLPEYRYHDLGGCFMRLFDELDELLAVAVRSGVVHVRLDEDQDRLVGKLDEAALACGRFILAVRSERPPAETAAKVPAIAKIASRRRIDMLIKANVPGVKLSVTHHPPPEIIVRPDTVYFEIAPRDPNWLGVLNDREVGIYIPRPYNTGAKNVELLGIPGTRT